MLFPDVQETSGENLMPDEVGYVEIRERVRQYYEHWGDPCAFEELQNLCYFVAVLAHGTPDLAVQNFSPVKQATVWEILYYMRVHHSEEIRLVRLVRDRMVENAKRQGMTAEEASVVAKVALCTYQRTQLRIMPVSKRAPVQSAVPALLFSFRMAEGNHARKILRAKICDTTLRRR
jgi:hypothetical protein